MLSLILNTIEEIIETEKRVTVKVTQKVTVNQQKILNLIKENPFITQEELSKNIGIAKKCNFKYEKTSRCRLNKAYWC